jgi:PAS domain S-box-containing protein
MKLRLRITPRLTLIFVAFGAVLLTGVGTLAYTNGRAALETATISDLLSTANEKQAGLESWFTGRQADIVALAASPAILSDAAVLAQADSGSVEAQAAHDRLIAELRTRAGSGQPYRELSVLEAQSGKISAATDASDEGKFKEDRPYFINGKNGPYLQNLFYSLDEQAPAIVVAAPLRLADGRLFGVLAGRLDLDEMNAIISRRSGLRQTDDAYLVNPSNLFVTQPRFMPDPAVLQRGVHTDAVKLCLAGSSGVVSAGDYRGVPAIVVYRWLPERQLCLIAKVDQAEALAPSYAFGSTLLGIGGLALLTAVLLAVSLSRTFTRPIVTLQAGAARFGRGELDTRLPETSHDELGLLAREFNLMAAALAEKELQLRAHAAELEQRVEERTAALRDSEARMAGVITSAMDAVITIDADQRIVLFNAAAEQTFRCTAADVIGQPIERFIPTRFRAAHREHIRKFAATGITSRTMGALTSLSAVRAGGEEFPIEASISQIVVGGQKLFTVILRDITERQRADEALAYERNLLRTLIDHMPDYVYVKDIESRFLVGNRSVARHMGAASPNGLVGKTDWDFYPPERAARFYADEQTILQSGQALIDHDEPNVDAAGNTKWILTTKLPMRDVHGRIVGLVGIGHDLTERKQAEEEILRLNQELEQRVLERTAQLDAANQELEAFSYSVSHDLRAPLRAIDGFSRILVRKSADELSPEAQRYLNLIRDNTQHMGRLVDDLLAFAHLNRQLLKRESVVMSRLVQQTLNDLKPEVAERQVDIHLGDLGTCAGDPSLLKQVWINLLSNALKFTRRSETALVEIGRLEEKGEHIYFVRDNGVGFDMQYYPKLFGVFQRLHRAEDYEGTGVGLAIVQRIITRHGGRVWAEAEVDRGATFYFTLGDGSPG